MEETYAEFAESAYQRELDRLSKSKSTSEKLIDACKSICELQVLTEEEMKNGSSRKFFDNGYGASIVSFQGSYGHEDGKYELAVLKGNEDDYNLCYDTPITSDVIGHLTMDEALEICEQIKKLPSRIKEEEE